MLLLVCKTLWYLPDVGTVDLLDHGPEIDTVVDIDHIALAPTLAPGLEGMSDIRVETLTK